MTDTDKAPASEVSSSDRAREKFEDYMVIIHHSTEDNLSVDPENDDLYLDCNIDLVWSAWQHQQSIIDSQRLALEESKLRESTIGWIDGQRKIETLQGEIEDLQEKICTQSERIEGLSEREDMLNEKIDELQIALEEKDREILALTKAHTAACEHYKVDNEQLQSRVKELSDGIKKYLDGDYPSARSYRHSAPHCPHGVRYWDDCHQCDTEYLAGLINQPGEQK